MRFLAKSSASPLAQSGLVYREGATKENKELKKRLLAEQRNFCAYTERYVKKTDATDLEHFDSSIKYQDNYFNYYAVLVWANRGKQDRSFAGNPFFTSRFFQDREQWEKRIRYIDFQYEAIDPADQEAEDLIAFLRLNHSDLCSDRRNSIQETVELFSEAGFDSAQILDWFRKHPESLDFITGLEVALDLDLSEFWMP